MSFPYEFRLYALFGACRPCDHRKPDSDRCHGVHQASEVVKKTELNRLLDRVERSRHPERDRVMILLSFKVGLRAKEIAELTWSMDTDASGEIADGIALPNSA